MVKRREWLLNENERMPSSILNKINNPLPAHPESEVLKLQRVQSFLLPNLRVFSHYRHTGWPVLPRRPPSQTPPPLARLGWPGSSAQATGLVTVGSSEG